MCVAFFLFHATIGSSNNDEASPALSHPYKLLLAANRDEFIARPTEPAHLWQETSNAHLHILAGTDLGAPAPAGRGGTWLGVSRARGRFAFLTNVRETTPRLDARGRGGLVRGFLVGAEAPRVYLQGVVQEAGEYNGFNLVVGDLRAGEVWYFGNRMGGDGMPIQLKDGIVYGLSNGTSLEEPRHTKVKVEKGIERVKKVLAGIQPRGELGEDAETKIVDALELAAEAPLSRDEVVEELLDILRDKSVPDHLPDFHSQSPMLKFLSPICIDQVGGYGTRTHTVVVVDSAWNAKMVEIDRYLVQENVSWEGKRILCIEDDMNGHDTDGESDSASLPGNGIEFCEQRRDFEFKIDYAKEDVAIVSESMEGAE
ncbi:NRDE protein-domain-containing protein [Chytriomyces sp. MP71]|nr:NRDE protein-domain-containing protein [Chytriomyces sp. MP71]